MARRERDRGREGRGRRGGDEGRVAGERLVNAAISEGVEAIIQQHPNFKGKENYILGHISKTKLNEAVAGIYDYFGEAERQAGRELSPEEKNQILYKYLADYVASGKVFDEAGKETILKSSLEEKAKAGFFKGLFARRALKGEKYLEKAIGAFSNLYELLKSGDYAGRMPEVTEAVTTVYDMGFLDAAVDVLGHYGLINDRKYNLLKKVIRKRTKEEAERAVSGIQQYASAARAAASILAIIGLGVLVLSGINLTGNVIGSSFNNFSGMLSALLLFIAALLILKKR